MDVAKYIGLFLLKNQFVYIHGLGNLELKKIASRHDGESLTAPHYEVIITPMGSIDDNLANFIASNEQVSISKASNALREFSMQSRAEIQSGGKVDIPSIGHFIQKDGKTTFITDNNFTYTPASIPAMKYAKREIEFVDKDPHITSSTAHSTPTPASSSTYTDDQYDSNSGISWLKVAMWLGILLILAVMGYFGYRYIQSRNTTSEIPLIVDPEKDSINIKGVTPPSDTGTSNTHTTAAITPANGMLSFDVIINTYDSKIRAESRASKLISYGNNVETRSTADSGIFYVVMPIKNFPAADTTKLLDSLRRTFNPGGVSILR